MKSSHLRSEAPWILGILGGLLCLWWRGYAFVPLPFIASYDWLEYVPSAWMVANGVDLGGYATWRSPLYPAMLGHLGEIIGYNEAGWLIASVSISLTVMAAGLGARALAGPWAGMVAAMSIPFINPVAEASRWTTLYPALTACTAVSLASGAAWARWRHPAFAFVAALFASVGWGIDFRGLALVAAVIVLIGLGLGRGAKLGLLAALLATLALGPAINRAVQISETKQTAIQVQTQRALELRLAIETGEPDLVQHCIDEPNDTPYPTLGTFFRPCAHAFVRDNLKRMSDQAPFGVGFTLLLLPLVLLPGRGGWRASASALVVFGCIWGSMLLMGVWARLNVHHFVQFAAGIAMTVPVAISRLVRTVGPDHRAREALLGLLGLGGLLWVSTQGPWSGQPVTELSQAEQHRLLGEILSDVQLRLKDEDTLLDCSGMGVEAALLPRRLHPGNPNFSASITSETCQRWMRLPPNANGGAWLLTRAEAGVAPPSPMRWRKASAWVDGPRQVWLWRAVDTAGDSP